MTDQDGHRHSYILRGSLHCINLKEAMSRVSLSKPKGRILRDVHVGGFHHTFIDPVKKQQKKNNMYTCTKHLNITCLCKFFLDTL